LPSEEVTMRRAEWLPVAIALLALLGSYAVYPADPADSRPPPDRPATENGLDPYREGVSRGYAEPIVVVLPREERSFPPAEGDPGPESAGIGGGVGGGNARSVRTRSGWRTATCGCRIRTGTPDGRATGCVDHGLEWLRLHQDPDGFWDADGFAKRCKITPACTGPGASDMDTAVTGLALLAYFGSGETHKHGRYKKVVKRALKHLKQVQGPDGSFAKGEDRRALLNHAIAALAMCESYALTGSPLFKLSAQLAVDRIGRLRLDTLDADVLTWSVMALHSAKGARLRVDAKRFEKAASWYTGDPCSHLSFSVFPPASVEAIAAAGALCRIFGGEDPKRSRVVKAGVADLLEPIRGGRAGELDPGARMFGTLACFQVGGDAWKTWNTTLKEHLILRQRTKDCAKGSWDPDGSHGAELGRIGVTALMMMTQQVYYRFAKVFGVR
jgi:hypothetical protein